MLVHLLESYDRDDSNKWSNIGFSKEITQVESIEIHSMHLIWCSESITLCLLAANFETIDDLCKQFKSRLDKKKNEATSEIQII